MNSMLLQSSDVLLQSNTSRDTGKDDTPLSTWWIVFLVLSCTLGVLGLSYGIEFWVSGEAHEKPGIWGTLSAPIYGLLTGLHFMATKTTDAVSAGTVGLFETTGKALTGTIDGIRGA